MINQHLFDALVLCGKSFMKKIKYRNNNYNNQEYSINYKFDSISPAGKCSGTALDLIKRYNELAKEAHSNGDYVEAEVFRQYAEHYRKIVTDINERKNTRYPIAAKENDAQDKENDTSTTDANSLESGSPEQQCTVTENVDNQPKVQTKSDENSSLVETKPKASRKAFTVIEVKQKRQRKSAKSENINSEAAKEDTINE